MNFSIVHWDGSKSDKKQLQLIAKTNSLQAACTLALALAMERMGEVHKSYIVYRKDSSRGYGEQLGSVYTSGDWNSQSRTFREKCAKALADWEAAQKKRNAYAKRRDAFDARYIGPKNARIAGWFQIHDRIWKDPTAQEHLCNERYEEAERRLAEIGIHPLAQAGSQQAGR